MADIFVDPIIIVVPAASADEEEVVAYLNTLYRWLEEALHSPHSWFYSNEAAYKLLESGLYPASELLQYWQRIHRHDWQSLVAKPLPYGFSPSFFDSITKYGLASNEIVLTRIIRAAATIIAEKAKDVKSYNLRQLRESEAADSKQRTRVEDNAKAWRLTITPDGVGWRMHYWYIVTAEGGLIEFANILKKHDPEDIY